MADILSASNRYDQLQADYHEYVRRRGPLKRHSRRYLEVMLLEVLAKEHELEAMHDDDFQSVAAALTEWREIKRRLVCMIKTK